jgi:hypothetical protein
MLTTVACVLRSGADYRPEHVSALRDQVARWLPGAPFVCLSDVPVDCERIPLRYDLPGWWSKVELCRPDLAGDLLFFDLDTRIVGPLDEIASVEGLVMRSDFYRPTRLASGMMRLTEAARRKAWAVWTRTPPQAHMARHGRLGDGSFFASAWSGQTVKRWQKILPGQVISYKVHVRRPVRRHLERGTGSVPEGARVVCFHGEPRPWGVDLGSAA